MFSEQRPCWALTRIDVLIDSCFCFQMSLTYRNPILWCVAPRVIDTFIENHGLRVKCLLPFARYAAAYSVLH